MRLTVSVVGDIFFEVVLLIPNLEGQDDVMSDPSPTYLPGMARPTGLLGAQDSRRHLSGS